MKTESGENIILVGYMILEDYADDMSMWSGYITGPDDPTGANLAWQDPVKMIEYSAYNQKVYELDKSRADHMKRIDELTKENEALRMRLKGYS